MCVRFKPNWAVMSLTLFQVSCSVHEKSPVEPHFLFEQVYQKSFSKTTSLNFTRMTIVNIQGARYEEGTKIMRSEKTYRVVNIGRRFPSEMNGVTGEVPATPLETKIWVAFRGKQGVIVARFIVTD